MPSRKSFFQWLIGYDPRARAEIEIMAGINQTFKASAQALSGKLHEANQEIDYLRKLLTATVENSPVRSVKTENGAIEVALQPPHWAVRSMAASFLDTLGNSPNWAAIEVGPFPTDEGKLIVTVCRADGESPVESVGKLRSCIEELLSLDGGTVYHPPGGPADAIFARARALLNPEKKD